MQKIIKIFGSLALSFLIVISFSKINVEAGISYSNGGAHTN